MTTRNYYIYDTYGDLKAKVHAANKRAAMMKYFNDRPDIYKYPSIGKVNRKTGELIASALNLKYNAPHGQLEMLVISW